MHKNVVALLISNRKAAKYIFKKVAQVDLDGGGWIYMDGSGPVSMAGTIPHSLFTCPSDDVSEIIFPCISTLFKKGRKKHSVCVYVCAGD